ncbi:MAG: hypothetical protein WBQ94_02230 [Terracidiphilus sp.]
MRITIPQHVSIPGSRIARKALPDCAMNFRPQMPAAILAMAIVAVPMCFASLPLAAQAPAATPTHPAADQTSRRTSHHGHGIPIQTPPATAVPAAPAPPEPEIPKWPVNENPDQAAVVWDSHGLRIDATNSSLQQIMTDVSTATGAKVEGLNRDERIFGSYGPGQARDVLTQLLEGSGYNVLMIGDQGQGTPRQIVFSARPTGGPQPAGRSNPAPVEEDNEAEEQPQPQPPQPEPGMNRGNFPPRTPQQQEMQMREQMRLQQMGQPPNPNQQPGTPPN